MRSVVVAGLVAAAAGSAAAPAAQAGDGNGRLLEFAKSGSSWVGYDRSHNQGASRLAGRPAALLDVDGKVRVYGLGAVGNLVEFTSGSDGSGDWKGLGSAESSTRGQLSAIRTKGTIRIFGRTTLGDLVEYHRTSTGVTVTNISTRTGMRIAGDPVGLSTGLGDYRVYARGNSGELLEFKYSASTTTTTTTVRAASNGGTSGFSVATIATSGFGSPMDGHPAAVVGSDGAIRVYSRTAADRLRETREASSGWQTIDVTSQTGWEVASDVAAVDNGGLRVYARSDADGTKPGDRLLELSPSDQSTTATWSATDLTAAASQTGFKIGSAPSVAYVDSVPHVFAQTVGKRLVEVVADGLNGRTWNLYDRTLGSNSTSEFISTGPAAVVQGSALRVFAQVVGPHTREPVQGMYHHCFIERFTSGCKAGLARMANAGFTHILSTHTFKATLGQMREYADFAACINNACATAPHPPVKIIWPMHLCPLHLELTFDPTGQDPKSKCDMGGVPHSLAGDFTGIINDPMTPCACDTSEEIIDYLVPALKDHPATGGWYMGDELPADFVKAPLNPASKFQAKADRIRALDPDHPRLYVGDLHSDPASVTVDPFWPTADLLGGDIYPVGHPNLDIDDVYTAGRGLAQVAEARGKQSVMALQAWPNPGAPFPTGQEMLAMRNLAPPTLSMILWYELGAVNSNPPNGSTAPTAAEKWSRVTYAAFDKTPPGTNKDLEGFDASGVREYKVSTDQLRSQYECLSPTDAFTVTDVVHGGSESVPVGAWAACPSHGKVVPTVSGSMELRVRAKTIYAADKTHVILDWVP